MAINKEKVRASAQKYLQKGQLDKAIQEYERLVEDDPGDVRTLLKLGDLQTRALMNQAATQTYTKVAQYYSQQGFFLKAVAVYKQILKIDPSLVDVNVKLAELYQQLGLMSDAVSQYRQLSTLYEQQNRVQDCVGVLRKMLELDADNVASRIKLAEIYAKQNKLDVALDEFRASATFLKQRQRIDDYVKVAERIAFFFPDDLATTRELADIYVQKGDARRALAKLQVCFKADPHDLATLSLLGTAFKELGQVPKTISVYKEMARIHREAGEQAQVVVMMRKVLELDATDAEAQAALNAASQDKRSASLGRINPAQRVATPPAGQRGATVHDTAVPVEEEPVEPGEVLNRLMVEAEIYVKYGLRGKALEHVRRVLSLDPNNREAQGKLKTLLIDTGDSAGAVELLWQMASEAHAAGDVDAARAHLEELLGLDAEHDEARALYAEYAPADDEAGIEVEVEGEWGESAAVEEQLADAPQLAGDEAADELAVEIEVDPAAEPPPDDDAGMAAPGGMLGAAEDDELVYGGAGFAAQEEALAAAEPVLEEPAPAFEEPELVVEEEEEEPAPPAPPAKLSPAARPAPMPAAPSKPAPAPAPKPAQAKASPRPSSMDTDLEALLASAVPARAKAAPSAAAHPPAATPAPSAKPAAPTPAAKRAVHAAADDLDALLADVAHSTKRSTTSSAKPPLEEPTLVDEPLADASDELLGDDDDEAMLVGGDEEALGAESGGELLVGGDEEALGAEGGGELLVGDEEESASPSDFGGEEEVALGEVAGDLADDSLASQAATPDVAQDFTEELSEPAASAVGEDAPPLSEEIEEIRFYAQQGLMDEARESLAALLESHPGHPGLLEVEAELSPPAADEDAAASEPIGEVSQAVDDGLEPEATVESMDIGAELEDELGSYGADDFQVSFSDVFDDFKRGVAETVDESDFQTHYDLGIAYREMGLIDDAIREFHIARRAPEREIGALTMIGVCELERGQHDAALAAFLQGLNSESVTPAEAVALRYDIGRAYEAMGRGGEALKFFEKAMSMDAQFRDVAQRVAELQSHGAQADADSELDQLLQETAAEKAAAAKISYL